MFIKKFAGKIIGASLTKNEKKALELETRKILAEETRKHKHEMAAMLLWVLHETEGYGPIKLRRVFDKFDKSIDELIAHYELADSDSVWLCTYKLKEYGIDINEWFNESRKEEVSNGSCNQT
jgi:hypothetical protein